VTTQNNMALVFHLSPQDRIAVGD